MHFVYKVRHMAGLGQALIILCAGEKGSARFAEYHIIVLRSDRNPIEQRFCIDRSMGVGNDEFVLKHVGQYALDRLQIEADKHAKQLFPHEPIAAAIKFDRGNDGDIRTLWLSGLCIQQLAQIAKVTYSAELKRFIESLRFLPVVHSRCGDESRALGQEK